MTKMTGITGMNRVTRMNRKPWMTSISGIKRMTG